MSTLIGNENHVYNVDSELFPVKIPKIIDPMQTIKHTNTLTH